MVKHLEDALIYFKHQDTCNGLGTKMIIDISKKENAILIQGLSEQLNEYEYF